MIWDVLSAHLVIGKVLARPDVHTAIHLARVGTDYLAADATGKGGGNGGLPLAVGPKMVIILLCSISLCLNQSTNIHKIRGFYHHFGENS